MHLGARWCNLQLSWVGILELNLPHETNLCLGLALVDVEETVSKQPAEQT